uniref:FA core complex associated protein 24 n=1 Tax=Saimiri boliviensis boliviensis TaxID=39432 RepID=A0A2K6ULL1_SAIBB
MERNPSDGTGPVHVPLGHVVANEKWRRSQLAQEMQGKIKLIFEDGLTPDFYLSNRCCVLYVTEADLVAGNGYRKRLVRVRNVSIRLGAAATLVIPALWKGAHVLFLSFAVQVQEQIKEPSKNPLLGKKRALLLSEPSLLRTVQQIPGVGKVKAPLLLQKFPSIQKLSNASIRELEQVVGQAVAQQVHAFFTQPR